ncbi:MAG: hypothetical protein KGJ84_09190 [Elusimicrobia bacterium]|nr:hypothetical protein [Elusimicrobiota bacterium]
MKLGRRFKSVLLWTSALLYASGLAVWALARWFTTDEGYGPQPSPWKPSVLHAHSVAGLFFLILFGYLWSAHVEPGLKQRKKKKSGVILLACFGILFATVPLLFYAVGETTRSGAAFVHTWLGAILLAPFLLHLRSKRA